MHNGERFDYSGSEAARANMGEQYNMPILKAFSCMSQNPGAWSRGIFMDIEAEKRKV